MAAHLTHDTPVAVAVTSFYFRIRHSHMRFPALASTNMSCHTERDSAAHHKYLQGHPSKLKKFKEEHAAELAQNPLFWDATTMNRYVPKGTNMRNWATRSGKVPSHRRRAVRR